MEVASSLPKCMGNLGKTYLHVCFCWAQNQAGTHSLRRFIPSFFSFWHSIRPQIILLLSQKIKTLLLLGFGEEEHKTSSMDGLCLFRCLGLCNWYGCWVYEGCVLVKIMILDLEHLYFIKKCAKCCLEFKLNFYHSTRYLCNWIHFIQTCLLLNLAEINSKIRSFKMV